MERLSKFAVMPGREEIPANIMEHDELFGVPFGAAAKVKQHMGDRRRPMETPGTVCIHFHTGNVTEVNVGYTMVMSAMAMIILKDVYDRMISTTPWAHIGDDDNVIEGNTMTYVSADGKDPRKGFTRSGIVPKPGGGVMLGLIEVPPRADGGLAPDTDYYFTQRAPHNDGKIVNVSNVEYSGTDDSEHGGEVDIVSAAPDVVVIPSDEVLVILAGALETAVPMTFGSSSGVYIDLSD